MQIRPEWGRRGIGFLFNGTDIHSSPGLTIGRVVTGFLARTAMASHIQLPDTPFHRASAVNSPLPANATPDAAAFDRLWSSYWLDVQSIGPLTTTRYRLMRDEARRWCAHPPERVLDVGCGPGRFLALLAKDWPSAEFRGVEPSQEARASAPQAIQPLILQGTLESHADALQAWQPDLIVCSEVLEHVPDPDATMAALARVAAPGATLILTVPAGRAHWSVQDDEAGHLRRFELDEFEALLDRHGLSRCRSYTWGGPVSALYNGLLNRLGPSQAAHSGRSRVGRLAARTFTALLRADDLFKGRERFQLIAAARKPA